VSKGSGDGGEVVVTTKQIDSYCATNEKLDILLCAKYMEEKDK
jgi:hypothetical protein